MLKYKLAFISLLIVLIASCASIGGTKSPGETRLTSMISPSIENIPLSEDEAEKKLAAIFQSWESLDETVTIEPNKKGFTVNGQQFLDPDGKILKYAVNHSTGYVTYLLDTGLGEYVIKSSRVPLVEEPITIATGRISGKGILSIQTNNEKQLQGLDVILLSKGFLIVGRNSVYRYLPGKGFSNFGTPGEGFHIASYQNGDVSSTNYILLEKTKTWSDNSNDPLDNIQSLWDITIDLAATFGLTTKEDYMLVNLKTGKVHPFDISIFGKDDHTYSNCQRQNDHVRKCHNMHSFESLYTLNGLHPNYSHYFWRIKWFNTPSGVIAIAQENESHDITLANLITGQKVVAFNSFTGFNAGFNTVQDTSGKITLTVAQKAYLPASIPFLGPQMLNAEVSKEKIDDVAEYIALHSKMKNME
ncbi:hypothetical protein PN36_18200 [Candidatus Thiomargarita nelsonii]|uniref:Lipoprotein n=1 Tax=Candidatus Thiomargarita nelsonii TaxID=1003181 RepID=A0A0A6P2G8_9GAMM|nr:hypothetical protein PN36_20510 [Candidatus Thiomargarita nelsonii]TGO02833.1 hypothetical protein PN36_18200 [Candidatus Thiomargarita nelsonii]